MALPRVTPLDARTRQVMSLDFIAPADRATAHDSASAAYKNLRVDTQRSWPIQGQVEIKGAASSFERQDSGYDEMSQSSPTSATEDLDLPAFGVAASESSDSSRLLARRREDDRHSYDEEEKYAILYFRIERGERWSDILENFKKLFPAGQPRRRFGKALTKVYVERRKGGLECRYYRLREDHGFKQLRSPAYDLDDDRRILAQLLVTLELSESFLLRLKSL